MVNPISAFFKVMGGWFRGIFGLIFKIKWRYWFSIILVIQAIIIGVQSSGGTFQGGAEAFIVALGDTFLNFLSNLGESTYNVIESGATFNGFWDMIGTLWEFIYNAYLIYFWIILLMKFWSWLPLSNDSDKGKNLIFAIMTFWTISAIHLLYLKYNIGSAWLGSYGFFDVIFFPVYIVKDFFRAIVIILTSTSFNKVIENQVNRTASDLVCNNDYCIK